MKFDEAVKDAMDAMKNAEVEIAYYIVDPDKKHASAIDQKLYVKKKDAEKEAKKLGLEIDVWPGLKFGGRGIYDAPKKYIIVEGKSAIEFLKKLSKSSNITIDDINDVDEVDDIEITIKRFPIKEIYTDGGEYSWEEALKADIDENYPGLNFEGSSGKDGIEVGYYFRDGIDALENFLKQYKVKI